jgi:hypothetical protein
LNVAGVFAFEAACSVDFKRGSPSLRAPMPFMVATWNGLRFDEHCVTQVTNRRILSAKTKVRRLTLGQVAWEV